MNTHLKRASEFAHLLDDQYSFLGIRFGWDVIIGLIPGLGTFLSFAISLYLFWIATDMGMPYRKAKGIIGLNVVDMLVGLIPILGLVFDVWFKANLISLRMIEEFELNKVVKLQADEE